MRAALSVNVTEADLCAANDNSENAESEADDLRKAHAQIFKYHQRLLELVSPSRSAGPLGPEEGVENVEQPLIASRSAIGFAGEGRRSYACFC